MSAFSQEASQQDPHRPTPLARADMKSYRLMITDDTIWRATCLRAAPHNPSYRLGFWRVLVAPQPARLAAGKTNSSTTIRISAVVSASRPLAGNARVRRPIGRAHQPVFPAAPRAPQPCAVVLTSASLPKSTARRVAVPLTLQVAGQRGVGR